MVGGPGAAVGGDDQRRGTDARIGQRHADLAGLAGLVDDRGLAALGHAVGADGRVRRVDELVGLERTVRGRQQRLGRVRREAVRGRPRPAGRRGRPQREAVVGRGDDVEVVLLVAGLVVAREHLVGAGPRDRPPGVPGDRAVGHPARRSRGRAGGARRGRSRRRRPRSAPRRGRSAGAGRSRDRPASRADRRRRRPGVGAASARTCRRRGGDRASVRRVRSPDPTTRPSRRSRGRRPSRAGV